MVDYMACFVYSGGMDAKPPSTEVQLRFAGLELLFEEVVLADRSVLKLRPWRPRRRATRSPSAGPLAYTLGAQRAGRQSKAKP